LIDAEESLREPAPLLNSAANIRFEKICYLQTPHHETMPFYFYHLKLELYSSPSPSATNTNSKLRTKAQERDLRREIYLPPSGCDIFSTSTWPKHKPVQADPHLQRVRKDISSSSGSESDGRSLNQKPAAGGVIDCGPSRATTSSEDDVDNDRITIPIASTTELEFPPPSPAHIQSDLGTASKDWRFGRVSVESVDMVEMAEHAAKPSARTRGESSSAISPTDGLNAALADVHVGRVTKARYQALEKNTEVGWGVVHLYRDGEETPELGAGLDVYPSGSEEEDTGKRIEDDCTVLCIPAVPSYLTPSDFLGFVGEKTREDVSHFRMVMTGRMNRYLVLMKFRNGAVARRWRKEWDGKVFNSMEVS
jgi:BRCA1-associated protein